MIGARSSLRLSASANIAVDATRMHATNRACKPRDTKREGSPRTRGTDTLGRRYESARIRTRRAGLLAPARRLRRQPPRHRRLDGDPDADERRGPRRPDAPEDTKAIRHVTVVVLDRLSLGSGRGRDRDPRRPRARRRTRTASRPFPRLAALALHRRGRSRRIRHPAPARSACARRTASPSCACGARAGRGPSTAPTQRARSRPPDQPDAAPPPRWGLKLDGLIEFPPVTAQGIGYVTTATRTLTAFETDTGNVVWRRPLNERMGASPGVVGRTRLRRLVRGPDPRVRRARRPPPLAEGARRGLRELAPGRRRAPPLRRQRRARACARPGDRQAALDDRRRRQGHDGRDRRRTGLAIVGDYERQRARARPAHRPRALADACRGPAVRRHLGAGRPALRRELDRQEPDGAAPRQRPRRSGSSRCTTSPSRARPSRATSSWRAATTGTCGRSGRPTGRCSGTSTWAARSTARRRSCAASSGQPASRQHLRARARERARLQRFGHGRYAGTSGDAHTLFLLGFSRIWGLR